MIAVRYFAVALFATATIFVGCDQVSEPTDQERAPSISNHTPPECARINVASDEYGTEIAPTIAPPGAEITLSGTTVRDESGQWAPSDRLEAWWDTSAPGSGVKLAEVDDMERCYFETSFRVPDVEPGRYKVHIIAWEEDHEEGYGLFRPHYFTVTDE